jgi:DNA-binding response OmpR family regulator
MRALVVEDDVDLAHVVRLYLQRDGMRVTHAVDGIEGWTAFRADPPDVVVLDLGLPGLDGLTLCRRIREASAVPVVVLTARDAEADELAALAGGADDFVRKPFSPRVLLARLHALLRRREPEDRDERVEAGRVSIDVGTRVVRVDGAATPPLRAKEFDLLCTLARRPGRVYTKGELEQALYGWDAFVGSRAIDQQVANLRAKLPDGALVRTVHGVGYALAP